MPELGVARTATSAAPVGLRRRGLDQATRLLYRYGWRIGTRLPDRLTELITDRGAVAALRRGGHYQDQLRQNLELATGQPVSSELLRAANASYLRNLIEMFALPGWTPAMISSRVSTTGEDVLRRAFAERGAVVPLPHSGNWDLAGAWACSTGMPVTTVAEQLFGPEVQAFLEFRTRLGMRVLSHTDPGVIGQLVGDARAGRLVCLVADRDLPGTGLPVRWRDQQVRMPAGPAVVARRAGAALIPAVCRFTRSGMRIDFGSEIDCRPGRRGLIAMTQQVADFFSSRIAEAPQDWHLMQPFFTPLPDVAA